MYNLSVLYFIEHVETKMVKIGITSNWSSRLTALKTGKLTSVIAIFECHDINAAERDMHEKARKYRLPGSEYFFLPKQLLNRLLRECKEAYKDVTQKIALYNYYRASSVLDVTGALNQSAADWLRLNQSTWKKSVIEQVTWSMEENGKTVDERLQFVQTIKSVSQNLPQAKRECYPDLHLNHLAAYSIWARFSTQIICLIPKKLFIKERTRIGVSCRPRRTLDLSKDVQIKWSTNEADINGVRVSRQAAESLLGLLFDYRMNQYCTEAYNYLLSPDSFDYYLSAYGPMTT
jgi:hypothetical protein